jgi:WD40 repeat protein
MFGRNQTENIQISHTILLVFAENFGACSVVQFNNDLVFAAGDDAAIRVWDHSTGQQKFTLSGHFSRVTALILHEDTNQLLR